MCVIKDRMDYAAITHFIASDGTKPMFRSFNAMLAYQYTSNLVTLGWLLDSGDLKEVLACEEYMAIRKVDRPPTGGVLKGLYVLVWSERASIDQLIGAAGAKLVTLESIQHCDALKVIILASDMKSILPLRLDQAIDSGAVRMTLKGFFDILLHTEFIIDDINPDPPLPPPPVLPTEEVHGSDIPPVTMDVGPSSMSSRDTNPHLSSTHQSTEKASRKSAATHTSKKASRKEMKPPMPKIYEVETDGTMLQGSREEAVATVQKFGFDLTFGHGPGVDAHVSDVDGHVPDVDGELKEIFWIPLVISPNRTLSNPNIGDPERANLGSTGTLFVFRTSISNRIIVRYNDSNGNPKFEAKVASEPHKSIFGNSGEQNVFAFDAIDKYFVSGGTFVEGADAALRRYFFWFESLPDLSIALFHVFNQDLGLVRAFFDKEGDFNPRGEITKPPHVIVKGEDDMDIDDSTRFRTDALNTDVAKEHEEDCVYAESQLKLF